MDADAKLVPPELILTSENVDRLLGDVANERPLDGR